jgi:hypothetical protein
VLHSRIECVGQLQCGARACAKDACALSSRDVAGCET